MNNLDYKCPNCDATLNFDTQLQKFKCDYCKSQFDENCFNGSSEYLIQFKISKKEAIKKFKKFCSRKWFIPNALNSKKQINKIKEVYIPYMLCDYETTGVINFECDIDSKWKSNGYKYIKTDKYEVIRSGNITLKNIPVNISKELPKDFIDSIHPFDYNELKKIDTSYISKFSVEKTNLNKERSIKKANELAKASFIEEIKKDIENYDKIDYIDSSINLRNIKCSYILLPIWLLNINYKNKIYTYVINGQTGKIEGDIPIDKKRIIFTWIVLFLFILVSLLSFNMLKVIL